MSHKQYRIDSALMYLNSLIRDGAEYPDAHWEATQKFNCDATDLQNAYDDQF